MTRTATNIQTPLRRRIHRATAQWLPGLMFLLMCAACVWLLQFQNQATTLLGEVEVAEFVIVSPQTGVISRVMPGPNEANPVYAPVTKGQLLVRLDDQAVRAQLDQIQAELLSLSRSAAVELARIDAFNNREVPVAATGRSSTIDVTPTTEDEQVSAELQAWRLGASTTERQLKQIEATRQQLDLRTLEFQLLTLVSNDDSDAATSDAARNDLMQRRSAMELALAKLNTELAFDGTSNRPNGRDAFAAVDESALSAAGRSLFRSFRRRCQLAQSQLVAATASAKSLDMYSPTDGQIDETYVRNLQAVTIGDPVVAVVPNQGSYVVVFAREHSLLRPFAGMPITLRSPANPRERFESVVETVGPKIESVPARQRANPRVEEWGRPVRIPVPRELNVEPGSVLEVTFGRDTHS